MDTKEPAATKHKANPREERFQMRLTAEDRAIMERGAELEGESVSMMMRRAGLKEARARIAKYGG